MKLLATVIVALLTLVTSMARASEQEGVVAVRAARLYVGDGQVIENGVVLVEDGRITAVGAGLAVPDGATVIELETGSITPGLIDANAMLEPTDMVQSQDPRQRNAVALLFGGENGCDEELPHLCDGTIACPLAVQHVELDDDQACPVCGGAEDGLHQFISGVQFGVSRTEGSSEVVPHTLVLDSLDMRSPDFDRLVAGGVTTVFASSDSAAVIGPRGAIVRTGGPIRDRIVREAGDVQATFGSDSFRVGGGNRTPSRRFVGSRTRRPNSRMGVAWVFRKAFYDTEKFVAGDPVTGADAPTAPAMQVLARVRDGDIGLRVQARTRADIETAYRLADEFGLSFTLLEATEAHECLELLAETNTPVVYGPIYMDPSGARSIAFGETRGARLSTMRDLLDAGIETALSAQDLREEDGLARQAMYAMRAGLTRDEVLAAVTLTPARLLGIDDETGTIEPGKHADLVLWSGEPFDATSQPVVVLIGGEVVLDRRGS